MISWASFVLAPQKLPLLGCPATVNVWQPLTQPSTALNCTWTPCDIDWLVRWEILSLLADLWCIIYARSANTGCDSVAIWVFTLHAVRALSLCWVMVDECKIKWKCPQHPSMNLFFKPTYSCSGPVWTVAGGLMSLPEFTEQNSWQQSELHKPQLLHTQAHVCQWTNWLIVLLLPQTLPYSAVYQVFE